MCSRRQAQDVNQGNILYTTANGPLRMRTETDEEAVGLNVVKQVHHRLQVNSFFLALMPFCYSVPVRMVGCVIFPLFIYYICSNTDSLIYNLYDCFSG